jgi:hypothetical protein
MITFILSVLVLAGLLLAPRWTLTALLFYLGHVTLGIIALVITVLTSILELLIYLSED